MSWAGGIETTLLFRRWVHSHEEDTQTEKVFRPTTFPFPRSRGRFSFELRIDGSFVEYGIGPTDWPQEMKGRWKLEGETLFFSMNLESQPSHLMHIISVDEKKLVIKK